MDDAKDINGFSGNTEDGAVGAMKQMAIGGAELLVFLGSARYGKVESGIIHDVLSLLP